MTPRRIHVTGGQGSGKTTLAARLHRVTGLPVHELDLIARIGGASGCRLRALAAAPPGVAHGRALPGRLDARPADSQGRLNTGPGDERRTVMILALNRFAPRRSRLVRRRRWLVWQPAAL